ncbi:helix-turn-helix domain-containing protein [Enterococcus termitis]|uniref:HTH cro/C1-type domain-containing protein n=1 Tax=Enterococcus termitis TaxID=332950 RepID=A0A1E5GII1_9ENTE|nr:helix-turn-helix transcriptional regulator [Enterococcus termitis]OEG12489.1 hypothetical protein BCR25_08100 [Enterococcus termitis]
MNAYMKIRRENKMSREELAERLQLPVGTIVCIEKATTPVPSMHFKENFKRIFNVTDSVIEAVQENG